MIHYSPGIIGEMVWAVEAAIYLADLAQEQVDLL